MRIVLLSMVAAMAAASSTALAAPITDPANDFLPTYTGAQNSDVDVLSSEVTVNYTLNQLILTGTMAGNVGTSSGASYIWGLDRGLGTERFVTGTPSIGAGVRFDLAVNATALGVATVNNIAAGTGAQSIPGTTVSILGPTITVSIPLSAFPLAAGGVSSQNGFTWNLWPRLGAGNAGIPDFAPNASNAPVSVVPAPGAAAVLGLGLLAARRRR